MAAPPDLLHTLLRARRESERDRAWSAFLEEHSRLILHAARRAASDDDDVMERYTYVLERLREDDFRRLRSYSLNGTGKFTTWLVVVVRRLCIDHHRHVFGRAPPASSAEADADRMARRNLAGLLATDVEMDRFPAPTPPPDRELIQRERSARLEAVLAELNPRDRLLLTLRYLDGHSPEKVARMLGLSSRFAVRRRLKVVLADLRRRLQEGGFGS